MVALAIHSGIPVQVWLDGDDRVLHTAFELVKQDTAPGRGGRVAGG